MLRSGNLCQTNTFSIMRKLMYFSITAVLFAACTKDDSTKKKDCETGTLHFTNNSSNPYNIYVDGSYYTTLDGKTFVEKDYSKGAHSLKAEQVSGYALYPTIRTADVFLNGCDKKEFVFP